jgi:hypothetical protein
MLLKEKGKSCYYMTYQDGENYLFLINPNIYNKLSNYWILPEGKELYPDYYGNL